MSDPTNYPHIEKRVDGRPWLIGTQTKFLRSRWIVRHTTGTPTRSGASIRASRMDKFTIAWPIITTIRRKWIESSMNSCAKSSISADNRVNLFCEPGSKLNRDRSRASWSLLSESVLGPVPF
jgi:hypothetical protein